MGLESKAQTRTIGNSSYTVMPLGAVKGRSVMLRLAKVLGPGIGAMSGSKNWGDAITKMAAILSDEDLTFVSDAFASHTSVQGEEGRSMQLSDIYGVHFASNYDNMLKWMGFCVEVNFGSFLGVLPGARGNPEKAE